MTLLARTVTYSLLIALSVGRVVSAQENLAPNPGFEKGDGLAPAEWSVGDPGPHARAEWATEAHSGERSLLGSADETGGMVWWNCDLIPVEPGQTYTVSVWHRCTNPEGGPPTMQIQAADGANLIDWNLPVRTSWTSFTQSFRLGPDDKQIRIALINYYRAGQAIYWDDVRLSKTFPEAEGRGATEVPVALKDAAQTSVAKRPYELGNRKPDFPPSVMFSDLDGWRMHLSPGMMATAAVSAQQRIWGKRCLRVNYHSTEAPPGDPYTSIGGRLAGTPPGGSLEIVPPAPIEITRPFDAVQLWVNADNYYSRHQPRITVRLLDGDDRAVDVTLGSVNWMYWFLMYAPMPEELKPPVRFDRLLVSSITNTSPLDIYFDALSFIEAPKGPIKRREWTDPLPFPTREETILPSVRAPVENAVREEGDGVFVLDCVTDDGPVTYSYQPRTGTLSDISAQVPGEGTWRPVSGGGPVLVDSGPIDGEAVAAELVAARVEGQSVVSEWRVTGGAEPFSLTYRLRAMGKSLVIDAKADRPVVSSFSAGRIVGALNPRVFWPPYANGTRWPQPHVLITDSRFASIYFDWYNTESSAFYGAGDVSEAGAHIFDRAEYLADTSGKRHALGERIFVTISNHFDEVLWTVANPPSPLRDILRTNLLVTRMHYGGGVDDYENEFAFWQHLKSYGVDHLTLRLHADFWRTRESFTLKDQAAPAKGGDAVAKRYLRRLRGLGYRVGLYTDYLLISPLSESWTPDMAALTPDGDRAEQAFAAYFLKPTRAAELQAIWAPRLHEKFGTSASYCDQMTQANTGWIEFDSRVPGAAQQRTVLQNWGRLLLNERVAHEGPCYSEGGYHAIWAGLCDGSYAQTFQANVPPFPDFALRKLHPLQADVGYDLDWIDHRADRQIAMQIVYGNGGMLWSGPWGGDLSDMNVPNLLRCYFMMQQLQHRYTMEPVESIRYFDGREWVDTDTALRGDASKRGQILTTYRNGLVVAVNTNQDEQLAVTLAGRQFLLPPHGWAACDADGFLEYSALVDGRRRDFVRSGEYVYFDGRGRKGAEGGIEARGQVIVQLREGALEVGLKERAYGHGVSRRVRRGPVQGVSQAPWGPVTHTVTPHGHASFAHQHSLVVIPVSPKPRVRVNLLTLGVAPAATVKLIYTTEAGETIATREHPWPEDGWVTLRWPRGAFAVNVSGG